MVYPVGSPAGRGDRPFEHGNIGFPLKYLQDSLGRACTCGRATDQGVRSRKAPPSFQTPNVRAA